MPSSNIHYSFTKVLPVLFESKEPASFPPCNVEPHVRACLHTHDFRFTRVRKPEPNGERLGMADRIGFTKLD